MNCSYINEKFILFIILLICTSLLSQTVQELKFESINFKNSEVIEGNHAGSAFEDSRGYIWFETLSGLFYYDGITLHKFLNNTKDNFTISDNKINCILEDPRHNLWIGTQNGLNYFDLKKKIFIRYNDSLKYGIGAIPIENLVYAPDGKLWVFSEKSLYIYDSVADQLKRSILNKLGPIYKVNFINNSVIINLYNRLAFQKAMNDTSYQFIDNLYILEIFSTANGDVLGISSDSKILRFHLTGVNFSSSIIDSTLINEQLSGIALKNENEIWIGTLNGLFSYNSKTNKYMSIKNSMDSSTYSKFPIRLLFQSKNNILWVNSDKLMKTNLNRLQFQSVKIDFSEFRAIPEYPEVFEYGRDTLLIPTKIGPAFLDLNSRNITPLNSLPLEAQDIWLKIGMICAFRESDERIWIGSKGVFLYDKLNGKFIDIEREIPELKRIRDQYIRKIYIDSNENLWLATWNDGIYKIGLKNKIFRHYKFYGSLGSTRTIFEDRNQKIWIGTRGGLLKYEKSLDSFKVYSHDEKNINTISENTAFAIYEDSMGNIWCGTYGGGLNKLDVETDKFINYTTNDGLINNNVFSIYPDNNGNLWLSTYAGLSLFNPNTEKFTNFTFENGLLNRGYDAFSFGRSRFGNRIYYAGSDGIDYIEPDNISLSKFKPPIFITDLKISNKSITILKPFEIKGKEFKLEEDISFQNEISLNYNHNIISLDYLALDYSAPNLIQYAYRLKGFDSTWQYVGNERSATYTNLDPGKYIFEVKATNSDGIWSDEHKKLNITISPPWYKTWWAYSFYGLSFFGAMFSFIQFRSRSLIKSNASLAEKIKILNENKIKEEENQSLKKRALEVENLAMRAQMNPHFIFNSLNSINHFILVNDKLNASAYLLKFSQLIRKILENSGQPLITLEQELTTLRLYIEMEALRFKQNFNFKIINSDDIDEEDIKVPPLIIQPFVENAIIHGLMPREEEASLIISTRHFNDAVEIKVIDNGIGRVASEKLKGDLQLHRSMGIQLTKERILLTDTSGDFIPEVIINDLYDIDNHPSGTEVTIKLPLL